MGGPGKLPCQDPTHPTMRAYCPCPRPTCTLRLVIWRVANQFQVQGRAIIGQPTCPILSKQGKVQMRQKFNSEASSRSVQAWTLEFLIISLNTDNKFVAQIQ